MSGRLAPSTEPGVLPGPELGIGWLGFQLWPCPLTCCILLDHGAFVHRIETKIPMLPTALHCLKAEQRCKPCRKRRNHYNLHVTHYRSAPGFPVTWTNSFPMRTALGDCPEGQPCPGWEAGQAGAAAEWGGTATLGAEAFARLRVLPGLITCDVTWFLCTFPAGNCSSGPVIVLI